MDEESRGRSCRGDALGRAGSRAPRRWCCWTGEAAQPWPRSIFQCGPPCFPSVLHFTLWGARFLWEKPVSVLPRRARRCRSQPSLEMPAVLEGDAVRRDCEMVTPRRGAAPQLAALPGATAWAALCPSLVGSSAPAPGAPRGPAALPAALPAAFPAGSLRHPRGRRPEVPHTCPPAKVSARRPRGARGAQPPGLPGRARHSLPASRPGTCGPCEHRGWGRRGVGRSEVAKGDWGFFRLLGRAGGQRVVVTFSCRFNVLLASSRLIWFRGFKPGQERSAGTGTGLWMPWE